MKPALKIALAIAGVSAVGFGGYFLYKYLNNRNNPAIPGGSSPGNTPSGAGAGTPTPPLAPTELKIQEAVTLWNRGAYAHVALIKELGVKMLYQYSAGTYVAKGFVFNGNRYGLNGSLWGPLSGSEIVKGSAAPIEKKWYID